MRMKDAPFAPPTAPREPTLRELEIALQRCYETGTHADHIGDETRADIISRQIAVKRVAMGLTPMHRIQPTGEQILPKPESRAEKIAGGVLGALIAAGVVVAILYKLGALTK